MLITYLHICAFRAFLCAVTETYKYYHKIDHTKIFIRNKNK